MAVTTFIPKVWEAALLESYKKTAIAQMITTPPTEIEGDTIIWNNVSNIAIKDYTGTVDYESLDLTDVQMKMNQKKYWAFAVDDVDKIQAAGNLITPHMEEAASGLGVTSDRYVLSQITDADATNVIGASGGKININAKNAYDYIVDLNTRLSKKKVPLSDRFVVVTYDYLGLLSKDDRFTKNYKVLENGVVEGAKVNGAQIVVSEELPANIVTALHKGAIGYGTQLRKTEALRLQDKFADAVRGLQVYGAKVLRKKGVAVMHWTLGA